MTLFTNAFLGFSKSTQQLLFSNQSLSSILIKQLQYFSISLSRQSQIFETSLTYIISLIILVSKQKVQNVEARIFELLRSREPFANTGLHVNRAAIKFFFAGIFFVAGAKHAKKFNYKPQTESYNDYLALYIKRFRSRETLARK